MSERERELEQNLDMANGCLAMVHETLERLIGKEAMESTPPMFYPEAIMSACAKAAQIAHDTGNPTPELPLTAPHTPEEREP